MPSKQEILQIQQDSLDFYTNPRNYAPLSRTKDHKIMVDCIHPTAPGSLDSKKPAYPDDLKIKAQTAGGAVGLGLDRAIGQTAATGNLVRIRQGIDVIDIQDPNVLPDAHHGCAMVAGMLAVLEEIKNPSDFTQEGFERWDKDHLLNFSRSRGLIKIRDAAARIQEDLTTQDDTDSLVHYVDQKYPERKNVRHMTGENVSRIYTQVFHSEVGIDRKKQTIAQTEIQGYVDNLGIMLDLTRRTIIGGREKYLNIGALGIRSFAVRTVLTRDHPEAVYLEVRNGGENPYDLQITEQERLYA